MKASITKRVIALESRLKQRNVKLSSPDLAALDEAIKRCEIKNPFFRPHKRAIDIWGGAFSYKEDRPNSQEKNAPPKKDETLILNALDELQAAFGGNKDADNG